MKNKMLPKIRYLPFYAISTLPMPVLYLLSDILFVVVYYLMKYRRNLVSDNIKKSFPQKPQITLRKIEKNFYRHFCDILVESIKTLTISKRSAMKRLRIENPDLVEHYLSENKNILLYTAHQGNWEWLIFLPLFFLTDQTLYTNQLKTTISIAYLKLSENDLVSIALNPPRDIGPLSTLNERMSLC
ncbi:MULTISPECIES: lysophospholipid acyltransferase family protein [Flavobacteriaceae]|uniref:Lipid A biosynthesis acyltransferase n=4 Tax=Flavobacteriaceae TaxID=49546 RepID=A0ABU7IYY7_9FLAO|nr:MULTISPECIES: hypothetical protein [Flavobacteriaceae]MAO15626.1 hypothetical protein [Allomuricauda sp.]RUA17267.1 MAG: hypothetical protein DSY83_04320 [Flavobacteriia bacterium]MBW8245220.1 hypothetical protein [Allomuricauda oceani]MDC6390807.1 hypothetical protein [Maribacter sp. PR1]MEE1978199.1 hypothetical protein [Maribacter cobaltidurans]|tara:strand:- start:1750 stop:2307 length:558 start_codon:yes stop_codon:yes gene_type:complete